MIQKQIRGMNALPSVTREARQKEAERIRKQKELDEIESLARAAKDVDEIIDISSGDEAAAADASVAAPVTITSEMGPLICTVASRPCVVNVETELLSKLKCHQLEGVKFIWGHLSDSDGFGCILADEMGLGKTLTSLVTLHALRLAGVCKHALIVCPSLVISTWTEQTEKWLPKSSGMRRLCAISPEVPHAKRLSKLQSWADQGGLCVIGYEMFRETCAQADSSSAVLLTATPDVVVVDEGKAAVMCIQPKPDPKTRSPAEV
jgi:SNF2 family DNA or RNA helicase